jgi:hypothetical protein
MTTIALLSWPLVTLILVMSLPFHKAVVISILGGFLVLPVEGGWDLPILPPIRKETIPSLTLVVLALLLHSGQRQPTRDAKDVPSYALPGWLPRSTLGSVCLVLFVFGSFGTVMMNGEPLFYGSTVIPGLRAYDGFSFALAGLVLFAPLLLGRKFFAHPERHAFLLKVLMAGGLVYSLLVLYELRMSPQLSNIIYGFFPHSFAQHVRGGGAWGWRPVVFMEHGLQLTLFMTTSTIAAFAVFRYFDGPLRSVFFVAGLWLLLVVFLSNSLGAFIIVIFFLPIVLFFGVRLQLLFATTLAAVIIAYPVLRSVDVIPLERLVAMAETVSAQRAQSLQFRFHHEEMLLEHALEKPVFGWGGWRRNRIFDEIGNDISVTDAAWVIVMGIRGWVGYLGQFGLLSLPVVLLTFNQMRFKVSGVTTMLSLVLVAGLVDLLLNSFLSPVSLLVAGALWGRLELGVVAPARSQATIPKTGGSLPGSELGWAGSRQLQNSSDGSAANDTGASTYTRQTVRHTRFQRSR